MPDIDHVTSTFPQRLRWHLARVLMNPIFDAFMAAVIVVNLVLVVMQADAKAAELTSASAAAQAARSGTNALPPDEVPYWLEVVPLIPLFIYMVELGARIYVWHLDFFSSSEHIFDFTIVFLDFFCVLLAAVVGDLPNASLLRVVRLAKLARTVKIFYGCHELYVIIMGFAGALRALLFGCILLFTLILLWGVVAVEILHPLVTEIAEGGGYDHCDRCPSAFATVFQSMVTFCQHILAGDGWSAMCMPLITAHPWTLILLLLVMISVNLGVLNLLLSAIVDNANESRSNNDKQKLIDNAKQFEHANKKLKIICEQMDSDKSGMLTYEEIAHGYTNDDAFFEMMQIMDVEEADMKTIFRIMDADKSGTVSAEEFVDEIYKMKTQELRGMLVFIRGHIQETQDEIRDLAEKMNREIGVQQQAHDEYQEILRHVRQGRAFFAQLGGTSSGATSSLHDGGNAAVVTCGVPLNSASSLSSVASIADIPIVTPKLQGARELGVSSASASVPSAPSVTAAGGAPALVGSAGVRPQNSAAITALQQAARLAEAQNVAIQGLQQQVDEFSQQVFKQADGQGSRELQAHIANSPRQPPPVVDDAFVAGTSWPDMPRGQGAYAAGPLIGSRLADRPLPCTMPLPRDR